MVAVPCKFDKLVSLAGGTGTMSDASPEIIESVAMSSRSSSGYPPLSPSLPSSPAEASEEIDDGQILEGPPRLTMPTLADHRGCGILAGDWIKPDPVMTRQETRRYAVAETYRWLTGRICVHAAAVGLEIPDARQVLAEVAAGSWPAARLHLILWAMEAGREYRLPTDPAERYVYAGRWAAQVCERYLREEREPRGALETMAVEFVVRDRLPGGGVIADFWNYSPFNALRNAPPLSEDDSPSDDEGAGAEAEAEAWGGEGGIDDRLDELTEGEVSTSCTFRGRRYEGRIPAWVIAAGAGCAVAYLWGVVALLSAARAV